MSILSVSFKLAAIGPTSAPGPTSAGSTPPTETGTSQPTGGQTPRPSTPTKPTGGKIKGINNLACMRIK